jgi:hypothetical protein
MWTTVGWLGLGVAWALLVRRSLLYGFDHDELEHVHSAWLVSQGERPYLDFFEHHHPLLWYYLSPFVSFWRDDARALIAARMALWPFIMLYSGATYLLARRLFDRHVALLAVLLLLTNVVVVGNVTEIRPDVPQAALGMLGVLLLYWQPRATRSKLLACGFALGVALLFLQKAIFLMLALGVVALWRDVAGVPARRHVIWLSAGCLLPLVGFAAWLALENDLSEYLLFNWLLNLKFQRTFSLLAIAQQEYQVHAAAWLFAAISLFCFDHDSRGKELRLIAILLGLSLSTVRMAFGQYWLPLVPLVAIFGAHGILAALESPRLRAVAISFAVLLPGTFTLGHLIRDDTLAKVDYVVRATQPSDLVYDGDARFNLFRHDIDFFWFSLQSGSGLDTYRSLREYCYDIYARIAEKRPKVVADHQIPDLKHPLIRDHYRQSAEFPELWIRIDE